MSNLKNVIIEALELRDVGPQVISHVDSLIRRAVIDTQRSNVLPPRKWTFTSSTQKQEYRDQDKTVYNFYYLPEDFRKLDEFRPLKTYPYSYTGDEYEMYADPTDTLSESQERNLQKKFTITDNNFDEDAKYEKILIARPFPEDTETVQIKYFVNGRSLDFEWLGEEHYETIIKWVYKELNLIDSNNFEENLSQTVHDAKDKSGSLVGHGGRSLSGKYFGSRNWNKNTERRKPYRNLW